MKLFRLTVEDDYLRDYDCVWGAIVCAKNKKAARALLSRYKRGDNDPKIWLDADLTSCEEISQEDEAIIMEDFHAG